MRRILAVGLIFALILIVAGCAAPTKEAPEVTPVPTEAGEVSTPKETPQPTPPPTPPGEPPQPTPPPTPTPAPEPQSFQGRGQQVSPKFTLDSGVAIFHMTHDGSSNFAIRLLDHEGQLVELLVNEIGPFDGSKAVGVKKGAIFGAKPGIHILDIAADGNWTVVIEQPRPTDAPKAPQTFTGQGQGVSPFFSLESGLVTFHMTHDGSSNFAICLLDHEGQLVELLVNEIGPFDGSKAVGVKKGTIFGAKSGIHILDIAADGNWTVSIE